MYDPFHIVIVFVFPSPGYELVHMIENIPSVRFELEFDICLFQNKQKKSRKPHLWHGLRGTLTTNIVIKLRFMEFQEHFISSAQIAHNVINHAS